MEGQPKKGSRNCFNYISTLQSLANGGANDEEESMVTESPPSSPSILGSSRVKRRTIDINKSPTRFVPDSQAAGASHSRDQTTTFAFKDLEVDIAGPETLESKLKRKSDFLITI